MFFTSREATELLQAVIAASQSCLKHLGVPFVPIGKYRTWEVPGGPLGMGYHYTGGPNGVSTCQWFNNIKWGNGGSSCHTVIFDRLIPQLEDIWPKTEASFFFKVPTLILFDPAYAAWHINWANSRLWGVENRNTGYSGYKKLDGGLSELGKVGFPWEDRIYEEYWREQIEANIILGRLWAAIRRDSFDPDWICGHSQIWATKLDPGPHFPTMHEMREAIWSSESIERIDWLERYECSPGVEIEGDYLDLDDLDADRGEAKQSWEVDPVVVIVPNEDEAVFAKQALWKLGWPTGPDWIDRSELKIFVAYFQRSTGAYKNSQPERVLKIDGIIGPKTIEGLKYQLKRLRL